MSLTIDQVKALVADQAMQIRMLTLQEESLLAQIQILQDRVTSLTPSTEENTK